MRCRAALFLASWTSAVRVLGVTVYGTNGAQSEGISSGSVTSTASTAGYTPAAFNTIVLQAPPAPSPPQTQFTLSLQQSAQNVQGLSIPQNGTFYGFSIEMSVVTQVIGINSTYIQVPFLNLMSVMAERAGSVHVRVGGNTQETAVLVDSLQDGAMIEKDKLASSNPTETPTLIFTPEFIYLFANVSALVNTKWFLGIPMNDTSNLRLQVAEVGETILADNLLGLQLGNEPDLYASHQHRPSNYSASDYTTEFGNIIQAIASDSSIPVRNNLIGPSVSGTWSPEDVWNTGFIPAYSQQLTALSVEHYPDNNCAAAFPGGAFGPVKDPQAVFPNYLNHTSGVGIVAPYLNSANIAQQAGKPLLMFETNSASCGGFPGVSDSFGAALWALDYGLQMAYSNFTGALLHVGGVSDTYNPFIPPQTNQSLFRSWTVGPVFYSAVAVAETFGRSGKAQIIDLQVDNIYTPAYGIYDESGLSRVALFNYVTDPSGASDYMATISVAGGTMPSQVSVKYLLAPSVSEKFNITWAGQTFGGQFEADGRLQGTESIQSASCDPSAGTCSVKVPAPGFALVFVANDALSASEPTATVTFSTTAMTKQPTSAFSVDPSVLATANGQNGADRANRGSTSKGSSGAASVHPSVAGLVSALAGLALLSGGLRH